MPLKTYIKQLLPSHYYQKVTASSVAKRIAKGSSWSLMGSVISRILILISMIIAARILGKELYGELGIIQTTLGMTGLLAGMGLGGTATRFVAQYVIVDPQRAGRIIALITSSSFATVFFATFILITTSGFISQSVLDSPHLQNPLILGAILMTATAFRGVQNGIFAGLEHFDIIAKLNILASVVSLISMVILTPLIGVNGAILGLATGAILTWFIGRVLLGKELERCGINVQYRGCLKDKKILTRYSLPNLLSSLVATPVLWYAMTVLSKTENGFSELGIYNAAYQWHGPMVFIPMILNSVSIPILVQEWESGQKGRFRKITFAICVLTLAITLPPSIIVAMLSPWVMSLYGQEFRDGYMILIFLVAAAPVHGISKIFSSVLLSMNRAWWIVIANSIWGGTFVLLSLMLIPQKHGLGLAISLCFSYIVLTGIEGGILFFNSSK